MTNRFQRLQDDSGTDWEPCPEGELLRLSRQLKGKQNRRQFLRGAVVIGGIASVGLGTWAVLSSGREHHYADVSCGEVMRLAKVYKTLTKQKQEQLLAHVKQCKHCKPTYQKLNLL